MEPGVFRFNLFNFTFPFISDKLSGKISKFGGFYVSLLGELHMRWMKLQLQLTHDNNYKIF